MADPIDITKNPFEMLGQKGAQNLAATGSTGMKPVDTSIQANFLLQRGLATGSTPDEIMSSAQNQTQELQKELQSQLIAATTNSEMTPAQMVASTILQIAPILIGAGVSGKAGAMVGAQSGYAGSQNFLKLTENSRERTRQNAALQAKSIQSQIDSLNKQYQSAQTNKMNADLKREMAEFSRDTALEGARIRASGDRALAQGLAGPRMPVEAQNRVSNLEEVAGLAGALSEEFKNFKEGYASYVAGTFSPSSKAGKLYQQVKLVQSAVTKAYNPGVASDQDTERFIAITEGRQPWPASPEEMASLMAGVETFLLKATAGQIRGFQELQTAEGVANKLARLDKKISEREEAKATLSPDARPVSFYENLNYSPEQIEAFRKQGLVKD